MNMIDTTIEDKLFREFKYGGAAYLALEYVNIAHEKDGFDVYPKNWQEFYKIKLPQIVKSRTDSYDDVPLFVSVDGERPLMWIEIESNISSCKTENELNRYLYSLLLPFKEWSDSICPIRYIQHAQQNIERCKRDIPLHIARAESLEDGWDKDEAFADAEACKDSIKKDEERIKRLEGSHDRFLQIFNDAAGRSVEWYCKAWFDVFCTYADNLDALLLKFGIDLYAVQDKCGIWLKPKRDVISIMGYVGTLELTQTLISQLPKNVNYPKQKELPPDLCTPKAMDVLKRAIVKGLLDENYMPTADMTKSQMKVFAIHASIECGFERRCYKPFETYWSVSNLAQTREVDGSDDKLEIVRNLFPKDVRKRAKHKNR